MMERQVSVLGRSIHIQQDLSLSHAGTVWDGALCLIAFLQKNQQMASHILQQQTVLELGSGTGILGMSASLFKTKKVYLTDLPQYLKFIASNIHSNLLSQQCECQPLEWGNLQHMNQFPTIDTIIASQVAYDAQCVKQLIQTIQYFLNINPNIQILISFQKYKQPERNFQVQFRKSINLPYTLTDWSKMDAEFRDEFIGIFYRDPSMSQQNP